ncbi:hypothetical protein [Rubinisphaera sp.]|mgnify:CR=1 FL=1|uniref:hypothetical protein n=1 Tax=Rubinisphaera sp. TaxID=2024857 RepID=UPI000C0CA92F|nr:hypothetical protein [Rubinisphaera sp.]MBV09292.1 hypothetical protein [Rubinisphaera sp.]HCS51900.1 hypothetical protein [Planctomycetaceae bacterium]|tara:strand:+ start:38 stop:403 length:366 start_codon:yes stop_codon:yes gene_type:complete
MSKCELIDGVLHICGRPVKTVSRVTKFYEFDDRVVARLYLSGHKFHGNNVECFDLEGKKLWTIEAPQYGPHLGDPSLPKSTYGNILKDEDGRLIGASVDGICYVINVEDGSVEVTDYPYLK